jgi:putative ABC transport system permease protein
VDVAVVAAVLALVALVAAVTALRAGRLRTVDALAVGRTTGSGRGRAAAALAARLPLPRPIGLGLARPLARPVRTVAMLLAIAFGAAAATFSIGLGSTLVRIQAATGHETADVEIDSRRAVEAGPNAPAGSGPEAEPDPAAVLATIRAQPGTEAAYAVREMPVSAAGLTEPAETNLLTGDSSWDGFEMVSGRWFGVGEAVVSGRFLAETGTSIGDTVTVTGGRTSLPVRIVGEVFETGPVVLTAIDSWDTAELGDDPLVYHVSVTDGTDAAKYAEELTTQLSSFGLRAAVNTAETDELLIVVQSLTGALTLLLVSVAGLGVLNTVILDLRDRIRDLGIHKALGMTPRQSVVMVLTSVTGAGLIGGLIGVPAGMALQSAVIPAMARVASVGVPEVFLDVYDWPLLVLLTLGGLAIAVLGALIPAGWAARVRVATALRTE